MARRTLAVLLVALATLGVAGRATAAAPAARATVVARATAAAGATAAPPAALPPIASGSGIRPGSPEARTPPAGAWSTESFDLTRYFTPAQMHRWARFHQRHRLLFLVELPISLVFLILMLGPLGRWLAGAADRLAARLARRRAFRGRAARRLGLALGRLFGADWASALLFAYGFSLLGTLVDLPFSIASEALDQAAGLSNYTAGAWIWDSVKAELVEAAVLSFLVIGLFGLIRRLPRRWWLALGIPTFFLLFAYGLVAPYQTRLYYDFHPLKNRTLLADIHRLTAHEHLSLKAVKVVKASRTTKALDAYFTGVGPSRELVLYDNLVKAMTPAEVVEAVGHELGHLRHRNVWVRYALSGLALFLLMGLLAWVLRRFGPPLGLSGPGDIRGLPLIFLVTFVLFNLTAPLNAAYSRHEERDADEVALTLTGNPDAFISMQVKLAEVNQADVKPPAWVHDWLASHPSTYARIGMGLWYRDWLSRHLDRASVRSVAARSAGAPPHAPGAAPHAAGPGG